MSAAFIDSVKEYIYSGFSGIWCVTAEPDDFETELYESSNKGNTLVLQWDVDRGLSARGPHAATAAGMHKGNPVAMLQAMPGLAAHFGLGGDDKRIVLVMHNLHLFLGTSPAVAQAVHNQVRDGRGANRFLVATAPSVRIPAELEHDFVVVEHPLPDRAQLRAIAAELLEGNGAEVPGDEALAPVLDAAIGLTRVEAEGAFARSLARHDALKPDTVWDLKVQAVKKSGVLSLYRGGERFSDLGGLEGMKRFTLDMIRSEDDHPDARPRGIMIVGQPGVGKSAFCKALGNEVGWPTLVFDFTGLKSKFVGESEQNLRKALRTADAMAPCILFCDEIEKALAGVGSHNPGDSGVSDGMFGTLLSWLNDHTSEVFFVASSNDVSRLPSAFTRAERFDRVFFVDTPGAAERELIWEMYLRRFDLDPSYERPDDSVWTGAEVRACCRTARRMRGLHSQPLLEAAKGLVPVALSAADETAARRRQAHNSYTDADTGAVYRMPEATPTTPKGKQTRRVTFKGEIN